MAPPGRQGGKRNATEALRRQAAREYQAKPSKANRELVARHHNIGESTLRSWIAAATTDVQPPLPFGDNTIYRRTAAATPVKDWLCENQRQGMPTPTWEEVVGQLKALEPGRVSDKSYGALRKRAERLLKVSAKEAHKYNVIDRSVGVERVPRQKLPRKCACVRACDSMCPNRLNMTECTDDTCPLGPQCTNREIQLGSSVCIERRACEGRGDGMFATGDIQKNALIREYVGLVIDDVAKVQLNKSGRGLYIMELADGFYVDAMHWGNESRLINHSHSPNCRAELWRINGEPRVGIFAAKKIKINTELTFNYGNNYYIKTCTCKRCVKQRTMTEASC